MTRLVVPFAFLACLLFSFPGAAFAESPIGAFGKRYLDGLFAAKPHLASFMGDPRFDDRWPDVSPAGVASRQKELTAQQAELQKLLLASPSLDDRIDGQILEDAIRLELLYLTEIREFTWDPRLFDSFPPYDPREIVADRLIGLTQRGQGAHAEARLASLTARLAHLPAFLQAMQAQLQRPARIYTERGIADNLGRMQTVQGEVKRFIDGFTSPHQAAARTRAEEARKSALSALQTYQRFLQQTLLPRSDGEWRLGAALFDKKYPLSLQTDRSPDQVVARAEARFLASRAELYLVAQRLYRKLSPQKPAPPENASPKEQGRVINEVKAELSKDHPQAAELVQAHGRSLSRMRTFIEHKNLLALPPEDTLSVEPMPAFKRGVVGAEYLAPDVLSREGPWRATYFVDPIDLSQPAAKIEGLLRANNNYEVQLTGMHEAYPGHHTQHFYARKSWNPVRAVLWNGPMEEGWACYATTLMVAQGWGRGADDRNDAYRFFDLLGSLVVAHNAILDVRLHRGQMTDAEAMRLMVEEGFQEPASAEKKLLRAKMDSTQLSQYFLGLVEIEDLEKDKKQQQSDRPFDQRAFNEALIGHGSIAVRYLRRYVLPEK